MQYKIPRKKKYIQPERKDVTNPIMALLRAKGWWCKKIHGSEFQSGLPDLYTHHPIHGYRWIEFKHPNQCRLENGGLSQRQISVFSEMSTFGVGIWVLNKPEQYELLFKVANWKEYCYFKGLR